MLLKASFTFIGGLFFTGVLSLFVGCTLWEYYHLAEVKGERPLTQVGIAGGMAYTVASFFQDAYPLLPMGILAGMVLAAFIIQLYKNEQPLSSIAITVFGVLYIALPLTCILLMILHPSSEHTPDGRWWFLYILLLTKSADMTGYIVGKAMGKTKLAPRISPLKTVEGAAAAVIVPIMISLWFPSLTLSFFKRMFIGLIISVLAQIGDLSESLLKRDAQVKDSNQLPGLGGALDILDSLLFTLPAGYFILSTLS